MTKWRHKTLKAVIQTDSVLGGQWEMVIPGKKPVEKLKETVSIEAVETKVETKKAESDDLTDITKKEIMQELDALGVEYNPRDKKQELYDLMMGK